jgi:putative ABC transport system ATP-binding protein
VLDIFQELNRERALTIVQVSHDENIARRAHRIIRLLDGEIEQQEVLDAQEAGQA